MQLRRAALVAGTLVFLSACSGQVASSEVPLTGCAGCHGSSGDSAPPRSAHGATATTDVGVGAHQAHVNPGPFRKAVPCSECHVVPARVDSPGHMDKDRADVVFGGLALSRGATPAWDPVTARCSNVYCHGGTLSGGTNTAPLWTRVDGTQVACGTCHGVPPPISSGHPAVAAGGTASCNPCHPGTVKPDGALDIGRGQHIDGVVQLGAAACTGCHGDATRLPAELAPAPPAVWTTCTTTPCPPAPTPGGGAHLKHLTGATYASPIACNECHAMPETLLGHPAGTVDMTWGPLASAGGAVPSWNGATCANYCHGATLVGGTQTAPPWTGIGLDCTSCHGMPPATPGHTNATPAATSSPSDCSRCHPATVTPGGTIDAGGGFHIDGYVEIGSLTCASCHGDRTRAVALQPAPPNDTSGNSDTTALGVGAHMQHLTGSSLRPPLACTECHPPVSSTSHWKGQSEVPIVWGSLATAGQSYPVWDRVGATCASSYCHGGTLTGGTNTVPLWTRVDGSQAACGTCHGMPPPEPHVQRDDCGTCHRGYTSTTVNLAIHMNGVGDTESLTCTTCHGDATRPMAATRPAPPLDTQGNAVPGARGVGAHQKHLAGGALGKAVACGECHPTPASPNHADGTVDMTWGSLAGAAGAVATWTGTTCTNYCHGATLTGGANTAPRWTRVDGSQAACGTCHGNPPPPPHSQGTSCAGCHAGYTTASVDPTTHLNGVVEATGSCTSCHGDAARPAAIASAPPVDTQGNTLTSFRGVGAHQLHLTDGSMRLAMACTECHAVPADMVSHPSGAMDMTWGPLAAGGGVVPTWNGATCTNYCHGAALAGGTGTAPAWNPPGPVDAAPACTTCHGMPPATLHAGGAHPPSGPTASACSACHPGTVSADGTLDLAGALHVDGSVEASAQSCTSCHGTATRTPASIAPAPPAVHAACPPPCSTPTPGGGAHLAHLDPITSATGVIARAVACSECHTVPTDSAHADGSAPLVTWGPLARNGGAAPAAWNGSTCSNTYCHGNFAGGTNSTPSWTGGALGCTSCHGSPPPAPHVQSAACGSCHAGYSSTTVDVATHVDGRVQSNPMTCSSCHGDPKRTLVSGADAQTRAAPPVDTLGNTTVSSRGVGAHLQHVNPPSTTGIAGPVACSECHAVPTTMTHADGAAAVTFGTLAKTGRVTPTWNGSTCSNTYCHGNFVGGTSSTPVWTTSGGLACNSCHASPPADNCHPAQYRHPGGIDCNDCHRDTNAAGTAINATNARLHVNGVKNGQCSECHDDESRICK